MRPEVSSQYSKEVFTTEDTESTEFFIFLHILHVLCGKDDK